MRISRLRLFYLSVAAFFIASLSPLHAADFITPTAVLERSTGKTILLSINFNKLSSADLTAFGIVRDSSDSFASAMAKLLSICVAETKTECSDTPPKVRYTPNPDPTITNIDNDFSAFVEPGSIVFTQDALELTLVNIKAKIRLRAENSARPFTNNTLVSTSITINNIPKRDSEIKPVYSKGVNETPHGMLVRGSKNSVTAFWDTVDPVSVEGGGTESPSGMLAIVMPADLITENLFDSYVYAENFDQQTTRSHCSLVTDDAAGTCDVTCEGDRNKQLLVPADLDRFAGDGVKYKVTGGTSASFDGLDNDRKYAIILQYLPDGLRRTCAISQATDAILMTQIATAKAPKASDSYCFIATAAYGSPLDAHLDTLRWFRNEYLLPTRWGLAFVRAYYRYGPEAAAYITDKPLLRAIVRGALWTPVACIEAYRRHPSLTLGLSSALMLLLGAMLLSRKKVVA